MNSFNQMIFLEKCWSEVLKEEFSKQYMQDLICFIEQERSSNVIYPKREDVFRAFNLTPLDKVKVVIIGQDPYHGIQQANGLCFSVSKGVKKPPSLKNIFKELKNDLHIDEPLDGCLDDWAKQGVLLLNSILTVKHAHPASHANKGWEKFTNTVIEKICELTKGTIFVAWGKYAQEKIEKIVSKYDSHFFLIATHPSPFSSHRGFFGCKHFSKINELLTKNKKEPINWLLI